MKYRFTLLLFGIFILNNLYPQSLVRREVNFPDPDGYLTLKCDFHIHTIFSNGMVWPTVRIEEAWMEGLDCISFTDHLEYHTFDKDVVYNDNRAYELAQPFAEKFNMVLIRGTEITRSKPLGHFNAIYTTDNNAIRVPDSLQSIAIANQQNAFVIWNHPGEDVGSFGEVQEKLFRLGYFKGIEVANHDTYYPDAQRWCMDRNLTMIATSDVHNPITFDYDFEKGEHRPMTLVFARDKTSDGIHEALLNQRTAVYWKDKLIGKEEFLKPLFDKSVVAQNAPFTFKKGVRNKSFIFIKNNSDAPLHLILNNTNAELKIGKKVMVKPNGITAIPIEFRSAETGERKITIPVIVENYLISPNASLRSEISIFLKVE